MAVVALDEVLQFPLYFKQAADVTITLTVVDNTGAPITNPTGWTARAQIRTGPGGAVLFEWNSSPGPGQGPAVLTYSGVTNISTLTLTATKAQTVLWTWAAAQWDCFLTNPASLSACVAEGTVAVEPAITM